MIKQPAQVFGDVVNKDMSYPEFLAWFDDYSHRIYKDAYSEGYDDGVSDMNKEGREI